MGRVVDSRGRLAWPTRVYVYEIERLNRVRAAAVVIDKIPYPASQIWTTKKKLAMIKTKNNPDRLAGLERFDSTAKTPENKAIEVKIASSGNRVGNEE